MNKHKIEWSRYGIYFVAVLMFIACIFLSPNFLTRVNLTNILKQMSVIMMAAFGETLLITMGGIDLAVGAEMALAGIVSIYVYYATQSLVLSLLTGIAVGALCGTALGTIVTKLHVPPFIAGLAVMEICRGSVYLLTGGYSLYKLGDFVFFGQSSIAGVIPMPAVFTAIVAVITYILLNKTRQGRYIYAIGGNEKAAAASGIKTDNVILRTYIVSSMIMGLAGVVLMARLNSGNPDAGDGYEFQAITAAVIGGTSMLGGVGTIQGTVVGALIVGMLQNIMNLNSIQPFVQQIVKGVIILLAVVYDLNSSRLHRAKKNKAKSAGNDAALAKNNQSGG